MVNLNINFSEANKISNGLAELSTECSSIATSCKGLASSSISSISPRAAAYVTQIQSSISGLSGQVSNFHSSFSGSIAIYQKAYEEQQASVDTLESNGSAGGTETIKIDDVKASELKATIDYYFNYPNKAKDMQEVSDSKLRDLFTANGATKIGDNTYSFSIDGKNYKYNVNSNEIMVDGVKEPELYCKFYTTADTSFSDITNTVTLLAGSGEISRGFDTTAQVNSNSLVVIPYGSQSIPNMPNKISACTRTGDFLAGGKEKTIVNTIVGYSLGGQAAYATVAANKGLYSKLAAVNSAPTTSSGNTNYLEKHGDYEAFKDVDIYIFEGSSDNFVNANIASLKRFRNNGVPMENIHVYTNDGDLLYEAKHLLPSENVYKVEKEYAKSHKGWGGHSYGYDMLKDSGIISYLSANPKERVASAQEETSQETDLSATTEVNVPTTGRAIIKGSNNGKTFRAIVDGEEWICPNTKINCIDYEAYVQKAGSYQNNGVGGGQCQTMSQVHSVDMMRGSYTTAREIEDGTVGEVWSPYNRMKGGVASTNQNDIWEYVYKELTNGRVVPLQVSQVDSYKGDRHWVTVCGISPSVKSAADLNPDTIMVLDCVDGELQKLSKSRAAGGHERYLYKWDGSYQVNGATPEFLEKEVNNNV